MFVLIKNCFHAHFCKAWAENTIKIYKNTLSKTGLSKGCLAAIFYIAIPPSTRIVSPVM